eukprot:TRINITY_DN3309_c0_g2_i1.p2 TRINITY_DN3309_c0_g2~~TRINITY_DN3309_c0_g2_i1.p2  ORF type:complete len:391 (+),score=193.27 TRINITY_DN3309_c0_g2_i1:92-1264(+)
MGETAEELAAQLAQLQEELRGLDDALSGGDAADQSAVQAEQRRLEELQQREAELQRARDEAEAQLGEELRGREQKLQRLMRQLEQLETQTGREAAAEAQQGSMRPERAAAVLSEVADTREKDLCDMYERLAALREEDAQVTRSLQELQNKAMQVIPAIQQEKETLLGDIATAWAREKDYLMQVYKNHMSIQHELFWHLKRGSYIKQKFVDPRNPRGQFEDKAGDFADHRLRSSEDRLLREHIDLSKRLENQKHEKIQIERTKEDMLRQWEASHIMRGGEVLYSKEGLVQYPEGSRPWYQQRRDRMVAQVAREERLTKDLINQNSYLRSVRSGMEDIKKQMSRAYEERMLHHAAQVERAKLDDRERRRKEREAQQIRHRVAKDPLALLDGQ